MNCETCHEQLVDYLYGELDDDQRQRFEAALEACPGCARELAELQQVHALADRAPTFGLRDDQRDAVLAAARTAALTLAAKNDTTGGTTEDTDAVVLRPNIFRHPALHIAIAALLTAGIASWLFLRDETALDTLSVPPNIEEMAALEATSEDHATEMERPTPAAATPPAATAEHSAVDEPRDPSVEAQPDDAGAQMALLRAEAPEAQRQRAAPDEAPPTPEDDDAGEADATAPTQIARATAPQAPAQARAATNAPAPASAVGATADGAGGNAAAATGGDTRMLAARAADEAPSELEAATPDDAPTEDLAPAATTVARASTSTDADAGAPPALRAEPFGAGVRALAPAPDDAQPPHVRGAEPHAEAVERPADASAALPPLTADEALGDAHQAWEASDYADAYARFTEIERAFPRAFARDAEALYRAADSARALQREGARDRWASAYLTHYPDGRHAERLRAWLGATGE